MPDGTGSVKTAWVIGVDLFGDDGQSADYDGPLVNLQAPDGYAIKELSKAEIGDLDPEATYERYVAIQKNDNIAEVGVEKSFSYGGDKLPGTDFELDLKTITFVFTPAGVTSSNSSVIGSLPKFA